MEKFRALDIWLPDQQKFLRINCAGESRRVLISKGRTWRPLLDIAASILGEPSDEDLAHMLAVFLLADAHKNKMAADLERILRILLNNPSSLMRQLEEAIWELSPHFRYSPDKDVSWRFPLIRRLLPYLRRVQHDGEMPWFSEDEWLEAAERAARSRNSEHADRVNMLLERVPRSGYFRPFAPPVEPSAVDALAEEFPNFGEVVEHYAAQLAIAKLGNGRLRLPPVLLLGEPGIGKSAFSARLAERLGVRDYAVSFSHATQGGQLGGLSTYWSNGRAGQVFDALLLGREMNPVFVLDEVDKAASESKYDPLGSLYALLEADSAAQFRDEYAEFAVDASWFSWVATANELDRLPEPIKSRLVVFDVRRPSKSELRQIGQRQYRRLVEKLGLAAHLPDEAPPALLDSALANPRELRLALQRAIGRMARDRLAGREVQFNAVVKSGAQRGRIGFL